MAESGDLAREELPLASIVADRVAIQPRIQLDEEAIEAYAEAVEKLPPVVVFRDPESGRSWLADGFHRLEAHIRAGRDTIPAVVRVGGKREASREAMFWAVGANRTNGVRMTAADRRRAVAMILSDPEGVQWPDSAIGDHCGVTAATVLARPGTMWHRKASQARLDPSGHVRARRGIAGAARPGETWYCKVSLAWLAPARRGQPSHRRRGRAGSGKSWLRIAGKRRD